MKYSKYIIVPMIAAMLMVNSCMQEDYRLGELVTPTNVDLTYVIVGADDDNPFGDGSGVVQFTASADHIITFTFDFGDGKNLEVSPDGKVSHVFSKTGINTYYVTLSAVGTGGLSATKTIAIDVFSSFTDDDALEFLTGGDSKTWFWAADLPAHVGLGPNFVDGTNHTWPAWYAAVPFEKTCMYDAEFVFTKVEDGLTFEQTAGPAFIPGTYAGKIGVEGDVCHGEDIVSSLYGVKNVSFGPASSIATEDGDYRGTVMSFSDGGFMCWYVGKSEFEIIEITENTLRIRIEEDETFAWYQTFTTTKPVQ
jgi:hypothetical protein